MDLVNGAGLVIVLMDHVTNSGAAKLLGLLRSSAHRTLGDQPCHHRPGRAQRRRCRLRPDRTGAGRRVRRGHREEDAPVFDRRQRRRAATLARERVASSV
jgi:hypothetical protein